MKKASLLLLSLGLIACQPKENKSMYPETKKIEQKDTFFGKVVIDPYRWLEDDLSTETKEWVMSQNKVSFNYLEKIPYRQTLQDRLESLWNYERFSAPFKRGKYTYFYKNDGLQNQSILYRELEGGEAEVYLDPNKFSEDGTTSLAGVFFTKDALLCAYSISEAGSDWRKVIVMNTETKEVIGETLVDIKFSGVAWKGNEGFYYSSYEKPKGSELSAKTQVHKLYYHKLGTSQKEDKVIFGNQEDQERRYVWASLTEDERFLVISAAEATSGNELYIQDLTDPKSTLQAIVKGFETEQNIIANEGSQLFISTNYQAPNKRLVQTDFTQLEKENWEDIIPTNDMVLRVGRAGNYFFANYLNGPSSLVKQFDLAGKEVRTIALPGAGTASGFDAKKEETELYFSFTNYVYPNTIFKLDIESGQSEVYKESSVQFDPAAYESKQITYKSKDGTEVPMIITHKKGIELNGKNPCMLYGYGGFNVSLTPSFSTARIIWLENGGIYAVPNLRGGGEFGKKWHDAGTKMQKQNVFDDFIAAAEYLVKEKYTSSEYLAINGGSNGGLLVGATLTQRPDLMAVAIPEVGVLDMLRYHTFTAGAGWAYDYGTANDSKEMFEYLLGYSPVHNVKAEVEYPAIMVMTGDHDDRVVPAHSFKFAAELQDKYKGEEPMLIRIATNAGHGAGKPTSKIIEEQVDKVVFALYNMGIKELEKEK